MIVRGGRVVGAWRRAPSTSTVSVAAKIFIRFAATGDPKRALASAIDRYARFLALDRA